MHLSIAYIKIMHNSELHTEFSSALAFYTVICIKSVAQEKKTKKQLQLGLHEI